MFVFPSSQLKGFTMSSWVRACGQMALNAKPGHSFSGPQFLHEPLEEAAGGNGGRNTGNVLYDVTCDT